MEPLYSTSLTRISHPTMSFCLLDLAKRQRKEDKVISGGFCILYACCLTCWLCAVAHRTHMVKKRIAIESKLNHTGCKFLTDTARIEQLLTPMMVPNLHTQELIQPSTTSANLLTTSGRQSAHFLSFISSLELKIHSIWQVVKLGPHPVSGIYLVISQSIIIPSLHIAEPTRSHDVCWI